MAQPVDQPTENEEEEQHADILVKEEERVLYGPVEPLRGHHEARRDHQEHKQRHTPMKQACRPAVSGQTVRHRKGIRLLSTILGG